MRWSFAAAAFVLVGLSSTDAFAQPTQNFHKTMDIMLGVRTGWFDADALDLDALDDTRHSFEQQDPRLNGVGRMFGVVGRYGFTIDFFRFGVSVGVIGVDGLTVVANELPEHAGGFIGAPFEAYAGLIYTKKKAAFRPYLEARGGLMVLRAEVQDEVFHAYPPNVGARTGGVLYLNNYLFVDAGIGVGFVGPERFSIDLALGLPISFRVL